MNITLQTHKCAQPGDIALLISAQNKRFLINLSPDLRLETHRGILHHNELIGLPWGTRVLSHLGSPFLLLQPSLADILIETRRNTQIMYPKDIGFILITMGIGPGVHVLEAGTGSGSLTTALAFIVGPTGQVISYETRPEMQRLAQKNLERVGLAGQVTFKMRDIVEGFDETDMDALFLDVPNPHDYLTQVRSALKPGGFFGSILPTTNQVSLLLVALKREGFGFIDVCEIILRYYKPVPDRLRPTDRMVAHTGYLIFARSIAEDIISPEFAQNPGDSTNSIPE
jgi:tRNA (adenine57-N1/adenine58-N1)-methyltransferase